MAAYDCVMLLMSVILMAVCSGQDTCKNGTNNTSQFYEMADNIEAASTGTVGEMSRRFKEERSEFCQDAGLRMYRTFNGTCNHPKNLGASFTIQDRFLPPAYSDGINSPRMFGVDGLPLPSARTVSSKIHVSKDRKASKFSIALMAWGQWVDHDIISTAVSTRPGKRIQCCGPNGTCPPFMTNPNCFPIEIPSDDRVFEGKCLEFVRSLAATDDNGYQKFPRAQINTVTSFLDASTVYGSTNELAESIRDPDGYLLRMKTDGFPPEAQNASCVKREEKQDYCFHAGDFRVNQHPFIGAIHTLFLREHNRICRRFRLLYPDLSDEKIFQMGRKLVGAMNQHFTYNVFLPLIMGDEAHVWKLISDSERSHYNPGMDPRIAVAFGSAAFRFGHSTIPSYLPVGNAQVQLRYLFNTNGYVMDDFEGILAGIAGITNSPDHSIQSVDKYVEDDVSKFLFFNNKTKRGLDLISINLQRARDHGVQPYYKWRAFCGLRPLTGFDDVEALGPDVGELAKVYRDVRDIDLFTGMLHEPVKTGIVGPTISCIIGMQFKRLKHADRFFFNNNEEYTRFTDEQLAALLNVTLGDIMCQNSYLEAVPENVFLTVSESNPLIPCTRLRQMGLDLTLFDY